MAINMILYHYYDLRTGPFRNLSELSIPDANDMIAKIKAERPASLCAQRDSGYMDRRRDYEKTMREMFIRKGGKAERPSPHYMVVGECMWLCEWYEQPAYVAIPIEEFDLDTVSFTYGDSFPTFSDRVADGREYRKNLYTYGEILELIAKYGLPQEWNADGKYGPERYIEAQVWSDMNVGKYMDNA